MIIDEITRDDVMMVLEHVQATCACRNNCEGCAYYITDEGCSLAHLPERWRLNQIGKEGDADDTGE